MHRMSDGSEPLDWHRHFSIAPSISVSDVSSLSFILPQFGGSKAKTKKEVPSSLPPPPPRALQTNLRFSRRHLRRPSFGGGRGRRARAWPHLPHSSSPEDTAEFEVTATNLGERERWRDAYDFHLRIQLCRCQGIQKCYGITCDA